VAAVLGLVSFAIVARGLTLDEFGALTLVVSYVGVMIRLCSFQSWQALINYAAGFAAQGEQSNIAATFRFGFYIDAAACVLAWVLAWSLAGVAAQVFAWRPQVEEAARLYAVVAAVSITGAPTAILRFYDRFDRLAWHQVLGAVVRLAMIAAVFVVEPTLQAFLYAWMASHVFSHLLLVGLSLRTLSDQGLMSRKMHQVPVTAVASSPMLRFLFASNVDGTLRIVRDLDVQVVALFVDEGAAGLLRIARQIAAFVGRLVDAFFHAIYPELAELAAADQWQRLRAFVGATSIRVGLFALMPLLGFVLIGETMLGWVFGDIYRAAYEVTVVLLLAMVVWGFAQPFAPAVLAVGRAWRLTAAHFVSACVYLSLIVSLVPVFAVAGAGWAMLGLYVVWGLVVFWTYQVFVPRDLAVA